MVFAHYNVEIAAEDVTQYCPGGYHPVHIGDCFNDGQYQILHKLGFGSFSTVWLARDIQAKRNVSLKIVVAEKSREFDNELRILKYLNELNGSSSHPGKKHVIHLLDSFYFDGPNGRHLCLVFDVIGRPLFSVVNERLNGRVARKISTQVLLAVDYLHSRKIVHGDIYPGNILLPVPELNNLSPEEVIHKFGTIITDKVSRKPSPKGVPRYLVHALQFNDMSTFGSCDVRLIDFGGSFFVDDPPKTITTPLRLHPPELVFDLGLSNAVDIWNLACTTYELVVGHPLFKARSANSDRVLIPQFKALIGDIPKDWVPSPLQDTAPDESPYRFNDFYFYPFEDELHYYYFDARYRSPLSKKDIKTLGKCLRKMLVLDPRHRAQTHELLGDLWFTKSDPSDLPVHDLHATCCSGWLKNVASSTRHLLGCMVGRK